MEILIYSHIKDVVKSLEIKSNDWVVIKPSLVFNPTKSDDIAEKVRFALNNDIPFTSQILQNKVCDFISLISNH